MTGAARRAGCSIRCGGGALWGRSTKVAGASAPEYPKCSYLLACPLAAGCFSRRIESNRIEARMPLLTTNQPHAFAHSCDKHNTHSQGRGSSIGSKQRVAITDRRRGRRATAA